MSCLRNISILFLALLVLVGCSDDQAVSSSETNVVDTEQTETVESKEEVNNETKPELLELEEAHQIVEKSVTEMNAIMHATAEGLYPQGGAKFSADFDDFGEEYQEALAVTDEVIGHLFTAEGFDVWGEPFTRNYACGGCELYMVFTEIEARYPLEIIEQSPEHFILTTYGFTGYDNVIGKSQWHYVLENDTWKLEVYDFLLPEDEPYGLIFEDIAGVFGEGFTIELIEKLETDNEKYIVVEVLDEYDNIIHYTYNTATGENSYEIGTK